MRFGATLLLLFGLSNYSSATVSCDHAHALTDVARRVPSYVIKSSSEPAISDSALPSGWYFAKDSVRYYTLVNGTAPEYVHCGTYNPIYIKEKLEKLDEGKEYEVDACLVDYDSNCKHIYTIKVRKCRQQIQYYLLPTDGTSAYCFEPSSFSVEEPAPDYKIPGKIQVSVALMYRRNISSNSTVPELDFKCNFNSTATIKTGSKGYYYGVSWVINGRIEKIFSPVMANDLDGTNLNETTIGKLKFKFGLTIQCAIRVSSAATGNQTNPQMSDTFYAGIKVLTPRITLNSGSSESILLQPTIPLGCRRSDVLQYLNVAAPPCDLGIEMFDPNSTYPCLDTVITLSNQKLCGSKITGWRNTTSKPCMHSHNVELCNSSSIISSLSRVSIQISASNDQLQYPEDKTFTVQLKTGNNAPHKFWENVRLDDVKVFYTGGSQNNEWKNKECSVINDPTLATFDGHRPSSISPSYINDSSHYLLYHNKESLAEVQIKTQLCDADSRNNSLTSVCTCAAAIQAGGDVFLIDICSDIKRAEFSRCRGNVLNVRKATDSYYEVYLPTGTKVTIEIRFYQTSNFLRIYIFPSPSDVNNTNGLCGNLDGNEETVNNDYYVKWKLQNSLFNPLPDNLPSSPLAYNHTVCICSKAFPSATSQNGQNDSTAAICFSREYAVCTEKIQLLEEKKTCTLKYKRSVERHRRNIERLLVLSLSSENSNNRVRKSITISHLTEEQAYKECLDVFKSKPTYNMIDELPDISLNDSLSACVNDMMVDGRDFWKEESYNSWVSVVTQEIDRNGTLREEKSEVVSNFKSLTCPSQCNFNGNCINGTCVCKDDYVGDSCFVKKSGLLELTDIEGGGECDLADGDDCHDCLQFHTKNLLKGFKCRIDTVDLDVNGTVISSDVHDRNGEYESMFDGYCCPFAVTKRRKKRDVISNTFTVRYSVSISNDGIHYGPGRNVHVFDSTCQSYVMMPTGDLIFSLKAGTCYIDSQCYREGERSLASPFLICCPFVTSYQWSIRQDCVPPTSNQGNDEKHSKFEIVVVSVSVSGILIVACVVVFAIWTYKSKKRTVSTTAEEPPNYSGYTDLDFSNQPYNKKFKSGGKTFQPGHPNVFTTDYGQQRKYDTNTRKYEQNT
ncbi:uncharacterized protein LOC132755297 isoform X2 [Ruditapes philippinarum]|uniref:uncharacterized protein LOC132755297 isoform X2 n=1 Tax=Ruditapes philippinarum TaxID=129788 RepID=UPI00295A7359|nr:uncharacterized protein LOC132755297 isoform X2 [Ruditapes philippinarum]